MAPNVGSTDRAIRIILGIFIISLAFWGPRSSWALLGFLPLATGLTGRCTPYAILGVSTCRMKK